MKKILKKILKKYKGKGGLETSPFKQVASPINLLKNDSEPPTAQKLAKSESNY